MNLPLKESRILKRLLFTRGQFWPWGIVVACVCPCVRQSWAYLRDNLSQVRAWITKFGPKNAKYFAQGPYCFRHWFGLTFQFKFTLLKNYVYLHRFCIFEIFVRHVCLTAPHPTWLRTHCLTTTCPPTGSRDRLWNCLAVYLAETIRVQPASTRRLALNFTNSCWFSTYCTHLTCRNFICQHWAIVETTVKLLPLAFIFVRLSMLGKPGFASNSAIFSAVNNYVTTLRGLTRAT